MEFGLPRNERNAPLRHIDPLRAEGNLTFRELISVIKFLWSEEHPDIPMKPVQSKTYTEYPVVVYSLQLKTPFQVEPKPKYREEIYQDGPNNYVIHGQRFDHLVKFSVITDNNPDLCEAIMEAFEDFMDRITPSLKRLGVSDMFYNRRMADTEETREAQDVEVRAVVYLIILEKITQMSVEKINDIIVNARVFIRNMDSATPSYDSATPNYLVPATIEDTYHSGI